MKKSEMWTICISIVSLLISIGTILATSPLIIEHYKRPVVNISGTPGFITDENVRTIFKVENAGKTKANTIYLKMFCLSKDKIAFNTAGVSDNKLESVRKFRFGNDLETEERTYTIPNLFAEQVVFLVVFSDKEQWNKAKEIARNNSDIIRNAVKFPDITNVICDNAKVNHNKKRIKQFGKGDKIEL